MGRGAKVVLIVIASVVALLVGFVVAGYFWFQKNRGRLLAEGQAAAAEGRAFAAGRSSAGCVGEALARLSRCSGLTCEIKHRLFLQGCLEAATPTPGECQGVPSGNEIFASARWALAECQARGHAGEQSCPRVLQAVQRHCHESQRAR
jgi:hypothetical protein